MMNSSHLEKKLLQITKDLPDEAIEEVINFTKSLRVKKRKSDQVPFEYELNDLSETEVNHLEEEFRDYKTRFPVE